MTVTMTYTIEINEQQRQLIMRCLTNSSNLVPELQKEPGYGAYDTAAEEFTCLIEMFGTLDADEKKYPGVTHGFCL